jgi:hypothetical protein
MKRIRFLASIFCYHRPRVTAHNLFLKSRQTPRNTQKYSLLAPTMADHPTLVKPPPDDPSKSAIENVLELTELAAIAPVCSLLKSFDLPHIHSLTLSLGHLHQYPGTMASTWSTRNLRRRRNRPMPGGSPENRSRELHSP